MATDLTNQQPKDTFGQLLHVDGGLTASLKFVYDGDGTQSVIQVSTAACSIDALTATTSFTCAGTIDFGSGTLEIPNSASPTVSAAGQIAIDTSITDHTGLLTYHDGTESLYAVSLPTGNLTASDGHVISYNATNNEFEMVAQTGGSDTFTSIEVDGSAQSTGAPTLDFDGTDFTLTESPTDDFDITINAERIQDIAGAMVTGNTETGISVAYQDADGTLDFTVSDTTVAGDTGSTGITPGDTLTIAGGANITTAMSGDTLTITGAAGGSGDEWGDVVDADIIPDADGTRDLGSTGTRFAETYTDALDVTNNITVGGTVDGRDLDTDGAKLDGIEASADVTDATNVNAAGATMNTDTDVSSNSWVLDEDTMSSDSNTKVPTQQSVKAYVDAAVRTDEQIEDTVGAMVTGNTETLISVSYQDGDGTLDFVVDNDLANYSNATSGFITDITGDPLSNLSDATITSIGADEILKWSGSAWINNTLAEAGIAAASHTHATSDITSGTFADARIAETNVTQHEAALTITESQISDLTHTTARTDEEIEDLAGGMWTGNTETGITVTYQDADGTIDAVVSDTTVAGDTGSTGITPGDTLTVAGGTEITTAMSGDTLTINADFTPSSTDTLTNKTFDANGTGNSLSNVDVADLANGTDGELITWDAAGAPTTVAVGTSGHVLTSNGAGAAPTFQAASGGGSDVTTGKVIAMTLILGY